MPVSPCAATLRVGNTARHEHSGEASSPCQWTTSSRPPAACPILIPEGSPFSSPLRAEIIPLGSFVAGVEAGRAAGNKPCIHFVIWQYCS